MAKRLLEFDQYSCDSHLIIDLQHCAGLTSGNHIRLDLKCWLNWFVIVTFCGGRIWTVPRRPTGVASLKWGLSRWITRCLIVYVGTVVTMYITRVPEWKLCWRLFVLEVSERIVPYRLLGEVTFSRRCIWIVPRRLTRVASLKGRLSRWKVKFVLLFGLPRVFVCTARIPYSSYFL